jgi:hypothetical protein
MTEETDASNQPLIEKRRLRKNNACCSLGGRGRAKQQKTCSAGGHGCTGVLFVMVWKRDVSTPLLIVSAPGDIKEHLGFAVLMVLTG